MKKILSIALCAAAVSAFADGASPANDVVLGTVGVTEITTSLSNAIVAISYDDLAGGQMVYSNLVKTANLTEGDKLVEFRDNKYTGWVLEKSGNVLYWREQNEFLVDGSGNQINLISPTADTVRGAVGKGIWLVRQNPTDEKGDAKPFYIYGKPVNDPKTTIVGSKINLVGNPLTRDVELTAAKFVSDPEGSAPADGDRIEIPGGDGVLGRLVYTYNEKVAAWITFGSDHMPTTGNPTIPANLGFWYVSKGSGFKIDWSSTAD